MKYKYKRSLSELFGDRIYCLFLIILAVMAVFPFVYMLLLSLLQTDTMTLTIKKLMTSTWSLDNYRRLFLGTGNFGKYLLNSAIIALYSCVVTCLVASMAAYAFSKKKFKGRDGIYAMFLFSMMVPGYAVLIPNFLILKELKLLNTYTGLAIPMSCLAYGVIMMRSFMMSMPNELLEAADIDGCGEYRKFFSIVMPLIKPALISLAIFNFINVWGNLIWPLIVAQGDKTTVTLAISALNNGQNVTQYGFVMAGATMAFLPPFILYLILQRQFVEGIALSGIKG